MTPSDWAAWYGASVATIVFGWELFKWLRSGSRLRIDVSHNMQMSDDTGRPKPEKYIAINVVNVGDQPATVSHLSIDYFSSLAARLRKSPTARMIIVHSPIAKPLPKLLDPGDTWTGAFPQTAELDKMLADGYLFVGLLNNSTGRSEYGCVRSKK